MWRYDLFTHNIELEVRITQNVLWVALLWLASLWPLFGSSVVLMKHSCSPSSQFSWAFFRLYGSWQEILPHWIPSVQHPPLRHPSLRSCPLWIPFWMLLLSIRLWRYSFWCHWSSSSSEVIATLHFNSLALLLLPGTLKAWDEEKSRANKAVTGLLTSQCLGKGAGSYTSLFYLLSPNFLLHS